MVKYYIYLEKNIDNETKEKYVCRRYYRKKLKSKDMSERLSYVGEAELSDGYFIIGSETHYTNFVDLNDIEFEYTALLKNRGKSIFRHTFQEALERAKEGILPYISFREHRVINKPILRINGKTHKAHNPLNLQIEEY